MYGIFCDCCWIAKVADDLTLNLLLIDNHYSESNFGGIVFCIAVNQQFTVLVADLAFSIESDCNGSRFAWFDWRFRILEFRAGARYINFTNDEGRTSFVGELVFESNCFALGSFRKFEITRGIKLKFRLLRKRKGGTQDEY